MLRQGLRPRRRSSSALSQRTISTTLGQPAWRPSRHRWKSSFPLTTSGTDRTSASRELLAVSLQARARVRLSLRSGRLGPSSSTLRGFRPIHRSGAAEMRAARLLPSWHSGTFRACCRRWSQQTPTVGRPGGWLSLRCVERRRE